MKLKLSCPEGWTYVSWQRCTLTDQVGNNMVDSLIPVFNKTCAEEDRVKGYETSEVCHVSDGCFFVLSGESFGIEDFAETLSEVLEMEVEVAE